MRIPFDEILIEVHLLPLQSEGNEEYVLVDTGCVLAAMRHFDSVVYRLERGTLRLAILEITINEVAEHLRRSQSKLSQKGFSTRGVRSAIENFRKLLQYDKVKKIANPVIPEKVLSFYAHFREDSLLAYVLFEGNFKALITQDSSLAERVGKDKYMPCKRLWTDQS